MSVVYLLVVVCFVLSYLVFVWLIRVSLVVVLWFCWVVGVIGRGMFMLKDIRLGWLMCCLYDIL